MHWKYQVKKIERRLDRQTEKYLWIHPLVGWLFVLIGMPLLILMLVCLGTAAIVLPMAWILGLT